MNKDLKKIISLFFRYGIILIFGIGNFYLLYKIFTPATIYSVNFILGLFSPTVLIGNAIMFRQITVEIAPPCVAGAAFFLLLALLLSTANVKYKTRVYAIFTAMMSLFVINIIRILILAPITTMKYFEIIHWIFWNVLSTVFVIGIYFITIKIYKIKSVPVYSDIKYLKRLSNKK